MNQTEIIINTEPVKDLLNELYKKMDGDITPATAEIGEILLNSVQKNFEEGGRPKKWKDYADLQDTTKAQRTKQKKWPGQILVRKGMSGGLMGSINYKPLKDGVIISANKKYAAVHQLGASKGQFGTVVAQIKSHTRERKGKKYQVSAHTRKMQVPWGDIPARHYLAVHDEDWREIREVLNDYLVRFA